MLLPEVTTAHAPILAEGGQPRSMRGTALCAALRRAGRMLGDPATPPGAVADMLESGPTPSIPPNLTSLSGPVQTNPLVREQ